MALATRLLEWLMRRPLTIGQRNQVVIHILGSLKAVPLSAIITTDEDGRLCIEGKPVDVELGRVLMNHARAAQENKALNLIRKQVQFEAFLGAAHKATTPEDLLFYRAAIWFGQRIELYLAQLSPSETPDL